MLDLAAAGALQVALVERLQLQHQGELFDVAEALGH
jgi:hypothetical protein